ncbi:hypothetical protein HYH03_017453, partial [Edaphochlamys debaryana]
MPGAGGTAAQSREPDGDSRTTPEMSAGTAAVEARPDDWRCPICMDLLYKPCCNQCGHAFCFWCMHHAMNPFRPSQCPLCRSPYAHFPR